MYIKRKITKSILPLIDKFQIISLMGPRQSGKTTLAKNIFKDYEYKNLEDPIILLAAKEDPKGFLKTSKKIIVDEAQKFPELFSYIQVLTDEDKDLKVVLTGSQNFLLNKNITQSLAGRVAIFKLLPFSYNEVSNLVESKTDSEIVFNGFYPRMFQHNIANAPYFENYLQTYIERDVSDLLNVKNVDNFVKFLQIIASSCGSIVNLTNIGNQLSLSKNTVKEWLNITNRSFITFELRPYSTNIKKQLTKSSKVYFYDTGLASYLLGIKSFEDLERSYLWGNLFENFIVSEFKKHTFNSSVLDDLFFVQNRSKNEIDLVHKKGHQIWDLYEIKAGMSYKKEFIKNVTLFENLFEGSSKNLIYRGDEEFTIKGTKIKNWKNILNKF